MTTTDHAPDPETEDDITPVDAEVVHSEYEES